MMESQNERETVSKLVGQLAALLKPVLHAPISGKADEIVAQLGFALLGITQPEKVISELLARVIGILNEIVRAVDQADCKSSAAPLLSVQHLRMLYTAIELLWQWGLGPQVSRASEFKLPSSQFPNAILANSRVVATVTDAISTHSAESPEQLLEMANCLGNLVCNSTFNGLMLQRNLDRLLLIYLLLVKRKTIDNMAVSEGIAQNATAALNALQSGPSPSSSMVVTKLRGFTKGPTWLREASLEMLSGILQSAGGLEIVLSGYLEGSLDSAYTEALQVHVAKLVTTPAAGADADAYLGNIAAQALDLLLYGLFKNDKTLLRVCTLITMRLAIVQPETCVRTILQPLSAPLLRIFPASPAHDALTLEGTKLENVYQKHILQAQAAANSATKITEITPVRDAAVVVDGVSLRLCVDMLHVLLTICPTHSALTLALARLRVDVAMTQLYGHLLAHTTSAQNFSDAETGLLNTAEEFCLSYIKHMGTRALPGLQDTLLSQYASNSDKARGEDGGFRVFHTLAKGQTEIRLSARSRMESLRAPGLAALSPQQILLHKKAPLESDNAGDIDMSAVMAHCSPGMTAVISLLTRLEETVTARLEADAQRAAASPGSAPSSSGATSVPRSDAPTVKSAGKPATGTPTTAVGKAAIDYQGCEYLASELFLRCLSGFLQISGTAAAVVSASDVKPEAEPTSEDAVTPAQYGVAMLQLQERLPSTALLRDGVQILKLLKAFLEHHAQSVTLQLSSELEEEVGAAAQSHALLTVHGGSAAPTVGLPAPPRRPLIEVIDSTSHDTRGDAAADSAVKSQESETLLAVSEKAELVECVLSLLAGILGMGQQLRAPAEEALIREMLEPLQVIAFHSDESPEGVTLAQTAGDVALMILSRSYNQSHPNAPTAQTQSPNAGTAQESFPMLLARMKTSEFLFADSPAMRGYGTRILLQYVQNRSPVPSKALSAEDMQLALDILLPLLVDQESFVYLNTLLVIRALANHQPGAVFTALLQSFATADSAAPTVVSVVHPTLPQARRAMVGEALAQLLVRARAVKDTRPAHYQKVVQMLPPLVAVCLKLSRQRPTSAAVVAVQDSVDLNRMRIIATAPDSASSSELATTDSATLALRSQTSEADIAIAAAAADQDILRQSAVALLAEAVVTAGEGAYRYLDDVLDIAVGVLSMETEFTQSARAVRRAAAHLAASAITSSQKGFIAAQLTTPGEKTGRTFDTFQRAYETLQRAALHDRDSVVAYHASQGLYALQDMHEVASQAALRGDAAKDVDGKREMYEKFNFHLK